MEKRAVFSPPACITSYRTSVPRSWISPPNIYTGRFSSVQWEQTFFRVSSEGTAGLTKSRRFLSVPVRSSSANTRGVSFCFIYHFT